jgi:hypothetical protein
LNHFNKNKVKKEIMETKTYQLHHENHDPKSTQPMKVVTKSPEDVIKVEFTEPKSTITHNVVPIQEVGTGSRVNQDLVVVPPSEQNDTKTVDPKTIELIQKIKMIVKSMELDEKQLVHWRKRKFNSALEVGENLVPIRMTFGKDKSGFRKLVETEFYTEFSYKTAKRYMKLFTNKKDIPSGVCTLRGSYLSLGILKEEYLDSDEKKENTLGNVVPTTPQQPKPGIAKEKDFISVKKKNLYDHPNSIFIGRFRLGSDTKLYQVEVNPNGKIYVINVEDDSLKGPAKPEFEDIVFEQLKPFVEWYNQKDQRNKEIESFKTTVYQLEEAA